MSALAAEQKAINLSQGYPDFPISPELIELVAHHMRQGHNQYAPMPGVPMLRQAISDKLEHTFSHRFDPDSEITVVAGATEGIYSALTAFVHEDDEVIIFDPAYDLYAPSVKLAGGKAVHLELEIPSFTIDWEKLEAAINPNTRVIVINNPNNPAGSVLTIDDMQKLSDLVVRNNLLVLSDEVYEHMVLKQPSLPSAQHRDCSTMAYDQDLADLMAQDLGPLPGLSEKKMFGGLAYMLNGNMLCGVHKDGAMYRVGKDNEAQALTLPGVGPMQFTGRRMGGMVEADEDAMQNAATRAKLTELVLSFVSPMPPK